MSRRFQFSLSRLLLTITFITLLGSHVFTSWKLKQAREDVSRMATELGRLTISDPDRLNVVALTTYDDMTWRWRVRVPSEREYIVFSATREIPFTGTPTAEGMIESWLPGEYIVAVAARRDRLGRWTLTIAVEGSSSRTLIAEADSKWLDDNANYTTMQAGRDATEAATSGEPFVLFQLNCERNATAAAAPPAPGATSEGIMIWAVEQRPDELSAAPVASGGAEEAGEPPINFAEPTTTPRPAE